MHELLEDNKDCILPAVGKEFLARLKDKKERFTEADRGPLEEVARCLGAEIL